MNITKKEIVSKNTPTCSRCGCLICYGCWERLNITNANIDHVDGHPENNNKYNKVLMHKRCNTEKGNQDGTDALKECNEEMGNILCHLCKND